MNREQEQNGTTVANSQSRIQTRVAQRRITWTGPLLLVTGRSALMFPAQALVALVFALQGRPIFWRSAAPWWTVYGTLVDLGCLALMWRFTRAEGITLRNLIGPTGRLEMRSFSLTAIFQRPVSTHGAQGDVDAAFARPA